MNVGYRETEAVRQLVEAGDIKRIQALVPTDITLLAAAELACCRSVSSPQHALLMPVIDAWAVRLPLLNTAIETLVGGKLPSRDRAFKREDSGFFPILHREWNDNDHHLFEGRFTAALKAGGFGTKTSMALAGAFKEMADNIVQHSAPAGHPPATGVLGYSVAQKTMTFVVADVGRGVLASLHENPEWRHLAESSDALEAVTQKHASRRIGMGPGGGFLQLFKSLADMQGHLIFRSGDGVLEIRGAPRARQGIKSYTVPFPGFQVSVSCSCG